MGQREIDPASLKRHPENWRTHPERQAAGLRAVLERVGMVQGVIVNRATGYILDGHLRVDAAIGAGQALIPITEVELTEDEERLVLATFDPIGGMAGVDEGMLSELVGVMTLPESLADVVKSIVGDDNDEEVFWGIGSPDDKREKRKDVAVSLRLLCSQVSSVEKALSAALDAGATNRGAALVSICEAYLAAR